MNWGFVSLLLVAILHGIAMGSFIGRANWPMTIVMFGFVVSDLAFAWMAWGIKT